MIPFHGRAFPRKKISASVLWSDWEMATYHQAHLRNKSPAGIYFESARDCDPGAIIHLQVQDIGEENLSKDPVQGRHARILWKKEINAPLRYGMGARYLVWTCSLCGTLLAPERCLDTEDIQLCFRCGEKIDTLPDGALKHGIAHFLTGNVV